MAKALNKDREARYQTAAELLNDLKRFKQNLEPRFQDLLGASASNSKLDRAVPAILRVWCMVEDTITRDWRRAKAFLRRELSQNQT